MPLQFQVIVSEFAVYQPNVRGEMPRIAQTLRVDRDAETGLGNAYMVYAYATHIAEVEVDMATGEVSVEEFVAVHDSGKIVNRQLAAGQVEGGIAQGLGYALMEEIPQKDGKLLTSGFTTYRIPTIRDVAAHTQVGFVEAVFSYGPYGAKGLGEVPLMASHTAVSRAVAHALRADVNSYPLSPDRVKGLIARQCNDARRQEA